MKLPPLLLQANIFALVGVAATAVQVVVSLLVHARLGTPKLAATLIGYLCAVGISYLGNSRLTFRKRALHGPQFVRFLTISSAGLAVNLAIVFASTQWLGWSYALAQVPVVAIVPAATFLMSRFWAFRADPPTQAA